MDREPHIGDWIMLKDTVAGVIVHVVMDDYGNPACVVVKEHEHRWHSIAVTDLEPRQAS